MAEVVRLTVYPIKGLDGQDVEITKILPGGTLQHDREFAMYTDAGNVINGKRTADVHRIRAEYDLKAMQATLTASTGDQLDCSLDSEVGTCERWLRSYFDSAVSLKRDQQCGYVDRRQMGPSVISTNTIREIASWYDTIDTDSVRQRLRANIEVEGVPAFWEDRFLGSNAPQFRIGEIEFSGLIPCGRCVVPKRDPTTGKEDTGFQQRFVERRAEQFPPWADRNAFDHFYATMIITEVPSKFRGQHLAVGDPVDW